MDSGLPANWYGEVGGRILLGGMIEGSTIFEMSDSFGETPETIDNSVRRLGIPYAMRASGKMYYGCSAIAIIMLKARNRLPNVFSQVRPHSMPGYKVSNIPEGAYQKRLANPIYRLARAINARFQDRLVFPRDILVAIVYDRNLFEVLLEWPECEELVDREDCKKTYAEIATPWEETLAMAGLPNKEQQVTEDDNKEQQVTEDDNKEQQVTEDDNKTQQMTEEATYVESGEMIDLLRQVVGEVKKRASAENVHKREALDAKAAVLDDIQAMDDEIRTLIEGRVTLLRDAGKDKLEAFSTSANAKFDARNQELSVVEMRIKKLHSAMSEAEGRVRRQELALQDARDSLAEANTSLLGAWSDFFRVKDLAINSWNEMVTHASTRESFKMATEDSLLHNGDRFADLVKERNAKVAKLKQEGEEKKAE